MTPFNINGKTIFINDVTKLLFMSDDEFNEEMRDLIAQDLGEEINNPFMNPEDATEYEPEILDDIRAEMDDMIDKNM